MLGGSHEDWDWLVSGNLPNEDIVVIPVTQTDMYIILTTNFLVRLYYYLYFVNGEIKAQWLYNLSIVIYLPSAYKQALLIASDRLTTEMAPVLPHFYAHPL